VLFGKELRQFPCSVFSWGLPFRFFCKQNPRGYHLRPNFDNTTVVDFEECTHPRQTADCLDMYDNRGDIYLEAHNYRAYHMHNLLDKNTAHSMTDYTVELGHELEMVFELAGHVLDPNQYHQYHLIQLAWLEQVLEQAMFGQVDQVGRV
jgi:hypothetical protein